MRKRVYVIEFQIQLNVYSLDKPKFETRVEYYSRNQRDDFINRYYDLQDKYYIQGIKTYFAELDEINVNDITNAV